MKLFDSNFKVLEKSLDAYTKRAEALADNMANVNTPDYKRKDVQFESFLQKALHEDGSTVVGRRTDEKHFKIGIENKLDSVESVFTEDKNTKLRNDGNNVDIEVEKVEQTKNNIRYQFATNRLTQNFTMIRNVIKTR